VTDAHLWTGGRVFTGRRYVEALLVEDGRVVAAGPRDRVLAQAATGTDRTDLAGALLILVSLFAEWNLPSVVVEGFWAAISVYGLVNRA